MANLAKPKRKVIGNHMPTALLNANKKARRLMNRPSRTIVIVLVVGITALTAIVHGFDGIIEIQLGLDGRHIQGRIQIDGRRDSR